jgi:hypothetical protein
VRAPALRTGRDRCPVALTAIQGRSRLLETGSEGSDALNFGPSDVGPLLNSSTLFDTPCVLDAASLRSRDTVAVEHPSRAADCTRDSPSQRCRSFSVYVLPLRLFCPPKRPHSLVFMLAMEGTTGLTGILVASDSASKAWLHHVSIDAIADLFDYVAREDVSGFRGSMIGGVMVTNRTSQHDLVEAGEAEYTDETRTEVRLFDDPQQVYRDAFTQAISKGLNSLP